MATSKLCAFVVLAVSCSRAFADGDVDDARAPHPPGATRESDIAGEIIVVTGTRVEQPRQAAPITTEVIDRQRLVESGAQTVGDALAARWCDRVALLAAGRMLAHGGPADVLAPAMLERAYGVRFERLHGEAGVVIAVA